MKNKTTMKGGNKEMIERKVYGVPKLPHKIDAMYDNVCRGNLSAYYLDGNPARNDPIYEKLGKLISPYFHIGIQKGSEKVASHLQNNVMSRQMNERTYNHIANIPTWALKMEFALKYAFDRRMRREISDENAYMFRSEKKEWVDQ